MRSRVWVPAALGMAVLSVVLARVVAEDYRYFQLLQLGDDLLGEGLPFQAARTYTSAIQLFPDEPIGYVKRADAEHRQGNLAPALTDLETAAELSGDVGLVSHRLGDVYSELGRYTDAAARYQELLTLDPEDTSVLYKLGLVYLRAGREAESLGALNRSLALEPNFWEAHYLRAAVNRALGRLADAESDYRRALELTPRSTLAREALIELYLEDERPAAAIEHIAAAIDADPGSAAPYLKLASAYRLAGRRAEAIETVGLALDQDENLPAAYRLLGELWLDDAAGGGDPVSLEKAISALETALKMDPASGETALALGRAYLAMRDDERSFAALQQATRATPIPAEAHRLLGDIYRSRESYAEAITAYHVFLRLAGDSPAVLERLGDTYSESGDSARAAETFLALAELEPRRVTPLVKAARAFLAAGEPQSAERVCLRGLASNPDDPTLLELLRESERASGDGAA